MFADQQNSVDEAGAFATAAGGHAKRNTNEHKNQAGRWKRESFVQLNAVPVGISRVNTLQ
jgi:hypothetical protein